MQSQHQQCADSPKYNRVSLRKSEKSNVNAASSSIVECNKEQCSSPKCSKHNNSKMKSRYERNMGFFRQLSRRFGLQANSDDLDFAAATAMTAEDDAQSSSTDSECSQNARMSSSSSVTDSNCHNSIGIGPKNATLDNSVENISGSSETNSSTADTQSNHQADEDDAAEQRQRKSNRSSFSHLQRRSTSIRRAFQRISLNSRSLSTEPTTSSSCSLQGDNSKPSPSKQPKKAISTLSMTTNANSNCAAATSTNKNKSKVKPPQRILRQPVSYTYLKGISGLPTQRVPRSVCCQYARR